MSRPEWMDRSYAAGRAGAFRRWRERHGLQWTPATRDAFYAGYDLAQGAELDEAAVPCSNTMIAYSIGPVQRVPVSPGRDGS